VGLCRACSVSVRVMVLSVCFVRFVWKSNYCESGMRNSMLEVIGGAIGGSGMMACQRGSYH